MIGILLLLLVPKKDNSSTQFRAENANDSKFATAVKQALKSGDFDQALKMGLSESMIETNSVCLLRMDLDSDGDQGLVAYAEGTNGKTLIQLEVDGNVYYDDVYPLDA